MQELFTKISDKFYQELSHCSQYPIPPMNLIRNAGSTDVPHYIDNMFIYTKDVIEQCMLKRNSKVWEIGCGAGRIPNGLINYLTVEGSYVGIDVDREAVAWCEKNIAVRNANFEFYPVNVANNYYYEDDNQELNKYDFSYLEDRQFDCAIALSVFNHLKLEDTKQYLQEISRRLTRNGVGYLTFFTIDADFFAFQERTKQHLSLNRHKNGIWYGYKRQSFFAGYESTVLEQLFAAANLRILNHSPGSWAQKKNSRIYLDWYLVTSDN